MGTDLSEELLRRVLMAEGIEDKEVLENTPRRWVTALRSMLGDGSEAFDFTVFPSDANNMVIVEGVEFSSLCSHHLLPFYGKAHVAYIPDGYVAGLSKLARAVRIASLGLWSQEELADEIMHQLTRRLRPKGVGVVMRAEHTCMSVRGVKAIGAITTTSSMSGVFLDNTNNARAEFLGLIR